MRKLNDPNWFVFVPNRVVSYQQRIDQIEALMRGPQFGFYSTFGTDLKTEKGDSEMVQKKEEKKFVVIIAIAGIPTYHGDVFDLAALERMAAAHKNMWIHGNQLRAEITIDQNTHSVDIVAKG